MSERRTYELEVCLECGVRLEMEDRWTVVIPAESGVCPYSPECEWPKSKTITVAEVEPAFRDTQEESK